jgi:hypothetical protein
MTESSNYKDYLGKNEAELVKILHHAMDLAIQRRNIRDLRQRIKDMNFWGIDFHQLETRVNEHGDNLLLAAIKANSVLSVKELIKCKANLEVQDTSLDQPACYQTALCLAVYNGNHDIIEAMINGKAKLPPPYAPDTTPEHLKHLKQNPEDWYIENVLDAVDLEILSAKTMALIMRTFRAQEHKQNKDTSPSHCTPLVNPRPSRPSPNNFSGSGLYPPRTNSGTTPHRGKLPSPAQTRTRLNSLTR